MEKYFVRSIWTWKYDGLIRFYQQPIKVNALTLVELFLEKVSHILFSVV